MNLKIADQAPNFSIFVEENKTKSLTDFVGKYLVLYFYPKDDTPGCTIEAQDFNNLIPDFKKLNCDILGISKDSVKSHLKFCQKYGMQIELGSDPEGVMCNDYGVWAEKSMFGKKYFGINRATFLIDDSGKIAHIWPKVSVNGHAQKVLEKLKTIQS